MNCLKFFPVLLKNKSLIFVLRTLNKGVIKEKRISRYILVDVTEIQLDIKSRKKVLFKGRIGRKKTLKKDFQAPKVTISEENITIAMDYDT